MGAGMAVAADDQRTGQAQAELGTHHVHDALTGFADVEQADVGVLGLGAQRGEQLGADGGGAGPARRAGDGVVGRGKGQLRAAHLEPTLLEVEQAARAAEVVQQVPVDVQQVGVVAEIGEGVGVPELGKQRARGHGPLGGLRVAS